MGTATYRKVDVDGVNVFYREAGPQDARTILLLHGFPTAGHMFRDLIPQLEDRFRLVAPDLPGFGQSDMPARSAFTYTFENIANVIDHFTELLGIHRFAIYVFDYGAPIGFRLAARHPDRITTIISQNGVGSARLSSSPSPRRERSSDRWVMRSSCSISPASQPSLSAARGHSPSMDSSPGASRREHAPAGFLKLLCGSKVRISGVSAGQ
jgi:pimeloyl-ACP methyl ester carboxylesterase